MSLYSFNVTLHAKPGDLKSGGVRTIAGCETDVLDVSPGELGRGFERTFEDVAELFGRFDRMFFEPDGSFVWVASSHEPNWQLDGVVYDRNGRVLYVDMKGSCPPPQLDQLLLVLGWPNTAVMFQLVREAVFLDEPAFRKFASAPAA